jgi:hypothetical protein
MAAIAACCACTQDLTPGSFCRSATLINCEREFACCTDVQLHDNGELAYATTPEQCAGAADVFCVLLFDVWDEAVESGRMRFDVSQANECLDDLRQNRDQCSAEPSERCGEPVIGLVEPGEGCEHNLECVDGGRCVFKRKDDGTFKKVDPDTGRGVGVCVARPRDGDACSSFENPCADGFSCSIDDVCVKRVAAGEDCSLSSECIEGLLCRDDQCRAPLAVGERCDVDDCREGAFCDDESRCRAQKKDGASCEFSFECLGICEDNQCVSLSSDSQTCTGP